ncbi:MAG TPA: hypothetical protein VLL97_06575, partial [Acidobacteriota bacterium]|nr:hypothetical protein [Acidobacteriota bacterium]
RVILRTPAGGTYGSVHIPVPIVLFFIMAVSLLPPLIGSTAVALQVRRMVVLLLTAAVTATMAMISLRHASSDMEYLHTKRGSLRLQEPGTMVMRQALDYIERNSSPGDYVLALPEGSSLNFLSDRPAPLRYEILTPGFLTENKEREAIRTLKEKNVGLLLVINRATPEFGPEVIGRDYYRTLMGWIEYNYEMTAIFGDGVSPDIEIGDPAFFIKCYRKRK